MSEMDQPHTDLMRAMSLIMAGQEVADGSLGKRNGQQLQNPPNKHRKKGGKGGMQESSKAETSLIMAMARLLLSHEDAKCHLPRDGIYGIRRASLRG